MVVLLLFDLLLVSALGLLSCWLFRAFSPWFTLEKARLEHRRTASSSRCVVVVVILVIVLQFMSSFLCCSFVYFVYFILFILFGGYMERSQDLSFLKKREVWWFLETYLQEDELRYGLSKATHWAYIYHDMDDNEPHFHVLLHYDNARSGNAVLRDFVGYANTFIERCHNGPVVCFEYLTHKNDPDKYQYSDDRIVCHNPVYWEHFIPDVRDRTQADFIEDLLYSDKIDLVYMAKKYGRDFIKNHKSYLDFRYTVRLNMEFNNE